MIKLNNLSTDLKHVTVEYLDIVNYEIARKIYAVISSYYPDYPKMPNPPKKNADGKQNTELNLLSG